MRTFILLLVFHIGVTAESQAFIDWYDLSGGIAFNSQSLDDPFQGFSIATFSEELTALEGKEVVLTGYFLRLDSNQSIYMLSKNPMASCFFCGNGGPETVVGLQFLERPSFDMDELLSVRGILRLNKDNPNQYYYRIEKADAFSLN